MKGKKILTLLGSICLALTLVVPMAACAGEAPAPVPGVAPTVTVTVTPTPGEIEPIHWRFSGAYQPDGWVGGGYRWFCDSIEKRTDGRLIIEPYYNSSLGFKMTENLHMQRDGLIEICEISSGASAGEELMSSMSMLFFAWSGIAASHYWTLNEWMPVMDKIYREEWNCHPFSVSTSLGNIQFFSKEPLTTIEDWQGLKVRTWGGIAMDFLAAIGCEPFMIDTSELYTALQRGMVEASITSYTSATEAHFWEVLNYIDQVTVASGDWLVVVNQDAYDDLPADIQEIFDDTAADYINWTLANDHIETYLREQMLLDGGMEFASPESGTIEKMQEMCKPLYLKFAEDAGRPEATKLLKDLGLL